MGNSIVIILYRGKQGSANSSNSMGNSIGIIVIILYRGKQGSANSYNSMGNSTVVILYRGKQL